MTELAVRGALVWTDQRLVDATVLVDGGRVVALESPARRTVAAEVIEAPGGWVVPGGIDLHVHFRDPGFGEKEDFESGSRAAALGGITTVLDMPNTRPAVLDADVLADKRRSVEARSWVDFGLIAAADGSNGDRIGELAEAGAAGFKIFLYERRDAPPSGVTDDAELLRLLSAIASAGARAHVHAENDALVTEGRRREGEGLAPGGSADWLAHPRSRPSLAEEEAVSRAIMFARDAGTSLHVCHLSSAAGLAQVAAAKRRGQAVTAEVTPQHLMLDDRAYADKGADLVMVPPVRTAADRAALEAGLLNGDVDVVATDHAPHTEADKTGAPLRISTGLVGVQWSYPLLLTQAIAGRTPLARVIDAMSTRAAGMLGWHGRKGVIRPGADADLVVIEPTPAVLRRSELASRGRSTPFDGATASCRVRATVVGGRVRVLDGDLVGEPSGRFVAPSPGRPLVS